MELEQAKIGVEKEEMQMHCMSNGIGYLQGDLFGAQWVHLWDEFESPEDMRLALDGTLIM